MVHNAASGEPLARALVRLEGDDTVGALTDNEGRFELPGLAPGPHVFEVVKPGFHFPGEYDDSINAFIRDPELGHNVIVAAGMPDLDLALAPANVIRGRIELSTGEPAPGIQVLLLRSSVQAGRAVWRSVGQTGTQSDGSYRFPGLNDGQYVLFTVPAFDSELSAALVAPGRGSNVVRSGYARRFYPDAADLNGAAKLSLRNGDQVQANFRLNLEAFHHVAAMATFPSGVAAEAKDHANFAVSVTVLDAQGRSLPYPASYDAGTHTAQSTLPDGAYSFLLTAAQTQPNIRLGRVFEHGPVAPLDTNSGLLAGTVDFTVAGRSIGNLRIPLAAVHAGSVQVTQQRSAEGSTPPAGGSRNVSISLSNADGAANDGMARGLAQGDAPGAIPVDFNPPGSYWVHTRLDNPHLCESSFTAGGANLGREPLVIGLNGAPAIPELILRDDCAKLIVSLPPALAAITAGEEHFYTVYVVPDFDSTMDSDPQILRPSTATRHTFEGLTPGDYHVYLFSGPEIEFEYRNRHRLAELPSSGQAVTLSPGITTNLVLELPAK